MPSTTAGVAVTASSVVKNHSWRRSPTVSGEMAESQAAENVRSCVRPHVGQSHSSMAAPAAPPSSSPEQPSAAATTAAAAATRTSRRVPPMAANLTLTSRS